jgi:hypothetical protein
LNLLSGCIVVDEINFTRSVVVENELVVVFDTVKSFVVLEDGD